MLFLYVRQNSLLGAPIILYAAPFLGCPIQPNVIFLWAYFCNHAALFIVPINSRKISPCLPYKKHAPTEKTLCFVVKNSLCAMVCYHCATTVLPLFYMIAQLYILYFQCFNLICATVLPVFVLYMRIEI